MPGESTTAGRLRRALPAALISLTTGPVLVMSAPPAALAASHPMSSISAGGSESCGIESGQAYCWGDNSTGELGDGSTADSSVPVAVDTSGVLAGKTLTQISVGFQDACALDSAGVAYCWGWNGEGELGDGSTADSSVPVAVDTSGVLAGKTLTQISAGDQVTCAVDSAGAAYCWGDNVWGDLGDGGSENSSSVPVAVDNIYSDLAGKTLTQISAGQQDTCAVDAAGAAYCWGNNYDGALGGGTSASSWGSPVAVDTKGVLAGKSLTQVSVAFLSACALDSAGAAYCWGWNSEGELGDGSTQQPDPSVAVAVDTSGVLAGKALTQLSAGDQEACALDSAGAAYCWGDNGEGGLGDGSTQNSSVPVAVDTSGVLAGKTLTQITVGSGHACALDSSGSAYCWGGNNSGELGDDSTSMSDMPVRVGPEAPTGVNAVPGDAAANRACRSSGPVTIRARAWLIAWVRSERALRLATISARRLLEVLRPVLMAAAPIGHRRQRTADVRGKLPSPGRMARCSQVMRGARLGRRARRRRVPSQETCERLGRTLLAVRAMSPA